MSYAVPALPPQTHLVLDTRARVFLHLSPYLACICSQRPLSILVLVGSAQIHGGVPNLRYAYRHFAPEITAVAGVIAFVSSLVMEIRHYRQTKALAGIARASQQ